MNKLSLTSKNQPATLPSISPGFTIVELLVVIVVIGILAAITIVSYTGIAQKAKIASLKSDLTSASQQLKLFQVESADESYPKTIRCDIYDSDINKCIKSSGNNLTYTPSNSTNPKTFTLDAASSDGTVTYRITNDSAPVVVTPPTSADADPANGLTLGTQVWAKANINVGTMVTGVDAQTDNSVIEKYCYNDLESNCTTYGALYQWDEAMQYVTTEGAQGICPTGSHIPTDNDWKILEIQLGMTQEQADIGLDWRGTDQGIKLRTNGTSGLNMSFAGLRNPDGYFGDRSSDTYLWSSSESSTDAWYRSLYSGLDNVLRGAYDKGYGFSVRCVKN